MAKQRENIISNDPALNDLYSGALPKMSKTFCAQTENYKKEKVKNIFNSKKDIIKAYVL